MSAKSKPSAKPKKPVKKPAKNPVVSRTIQIRGNQTLEDLHFAIFDAFDREDEHCYEFQFGKKPMDPNAIVFTMPEIHESDQDDMGREVCRADKAKIESLGLRVGQLFGYWFDFGDD